MNEKVNNAKDLAFSFETQNKRPEQISRKFGKPFKEITIRESLSLTEIY